MQRSEEHTSELQSLRHLVCRLLLDPAPPAISTLSLHDALPISSDRRTLWLVRATSGLPGCGVSLARKHQRSQSVFSDGLGGTDADFAPRHTPLLLRQTDYADAEIGRAHV